MASSKLVWTSDPEEAKRLRKSGEIDTGKDADAAKQVIHVGVDRKRRAGKTVTMAIGFQHTPETLARIAASLKKKCGAGGTARGGEIEIQGDHVERIAAELESMGYRVRK